jgi:hypothetical protein
MADFVAAGAVGRQRTGVNGAVDRGRDGAIMRERTAPPATPTPVAGHPAATRGRAATMRGYLAEGAEAAPSLPMSPVAFGLVAIGVFAVLLAITLAFRNVSNRH